MSVFYRARAALVDPGWSCCPHCGRRGSARSSLWQAASMCDGPRTHCGQLLRARGRKSAPCLRSRKIRMLPCV